MNGVLMENFDSNYEGRRIQPLANVRRFVSNKRKSRQVVYESVPLMSTNTDSNSDEEVTLHDIRHFQKVPENDFVNSIRQIKKLDENRNGDLSENKKVDSFQSCDFVYLNISEGDTLQSISIKYQCSISDIKRANNLISSQEFYGLKQLKIPVKKYSLLTEILASTPENKSNSTLVEEHDSDVRTISIGIGMAGRCPSPQDSVAFFKRMDEDLVKIMLSTNSQKDSLEAAATALTTHQIQPLVKESYNSFVQWNYLIFFILIVAVVIPAIVALFMHYNRSSHEHESHAYPVNSSNEGYNVMPQSSIKDNS